MKLPIVAAIIMLIRLGGCVPAPAHKSPPAPHRCPVTVCRPYPSPIVPNPPGVY